MILPVGTLIEAETGLESKGCPLGGTVVQSAVGIRQVLDCIVHILDHFLHYELAAVPWSHEVLIGRAELVVDPRHVTESLDLVEIEIGPEETAERSVLHSCLRIFALLRYIIQTGVDSAKVTPAPSAAGSGNETVASALHQVRRILMDVLVALLVVDILREQVVVIRIGEKLQVCCSLEVSLRTEL